jgi:transposase InsO family protein
LARAQAWFADHGITIQQVLTDNGGCYRSHRWHQICQQLAITPSGPGLSPPDQRQGERFNRTLVEGWAYRRLYPSEAARRAAFSPGCTGITITGPTAHSDVVHRSPAAPTSPSPTADSSGATLDVRDLPEAGQVPWGW